MRVTFAGRWSGWQCEDSPHTSTTSKLTASFTTTADSGQVTTSATNTMYCKHKAIKKERKRVGREREGREGEWGSKERGGRGVRQRER